MECVGWMLTFKTSVLQICLWALLRMNCFHLNRAILFPKAASREVCQPQLFPSCPGSCWIASNVFQCVLEIPSSEHLESCFIHFQYPEAFIQFVVIYYLFQFFSLELTSHNWASNFWSETFVPRPCYSQLCPEVKIMVGNLTLMFRVGCVQMPAVMQMNSVILSQLQLLNLTELSVTFVGTMKIKMFPPSEVFEELPSEIIYVKWLAYCSSINGGYYCYYSCHQNHRVFLHYKVEWYLLPVCFPFDTHKWLQKRKIDVIKQGSDENASLPSSLSHKLPLESLYLERTPNSY